MKLISLFILVLLLTTFACTQNKNGVESINYPTEGLPDDSAKLFASGIISSDLFEHSAPSFSPDGQTVLWSILELPSYKARILEMNYEHGKWSVPHSPSFSDSSASDISPAFSPDGKTLYFSSGRKLPTGQFPSKGNALWTVTKTVKDWAELHPLDSVVSKGGEYAPSVATSGNLYFTYGPFRSPDWNILISENVNGSNSRPIPLPSPINTNGYEDGACIAPDESYLIFESDRPGGTDGSIDLYISFKSKNGSWSNPLNMGPRINTGASERFARVSPDGKYLFFGSNRRQLEGKPNFDIYWIDASIIAMLKEQVDK